MEREVPKIKIVMEKKRVLINGDIPVKFIDISGTIVENSIFLWPF
jgi:hypothetical protein